MRDEKGRILPGHSLNPGGYPKVLGEITKLARDKCPQAIAELARILTTADKDSDRIAAAQIILDRGLGKPMQAVELSGPEGGSIQVSAVDAPPRETREQWIERRKKELLLIGNDKEAA